MLTMNKHAFTLIELLCVVAILGILLAIMIPNFLNAQTRAKVSRMKADVVTVGNAIELYRIDNNSRIYPMRRAEHPYSIPLRFYIVIPEDVFSDLTHQLLSIGYSDLLPVWEGNIVLSFGPDREQGPGYNIVGGSFMRWQLIDYDSSNGLISLGDITWPYFGHPLLTLQ